MTWYRGIFTAGSIAVLFGASLLTDLDPSRQVHALTVAVVFALLAIAWRPIEDE